jgi:hypothetical protein
VHIYSNSMETTSDVVQSLLGEHLKIDQALATIDFPKDFAQLSDILERIQQSTTLKTHFAANIAESIQNLKVSVVKAEASLMISDISGMRKNYAQVHQQNGILVGEYIKRTNNHQDLVSNLKNLNNFIRFASNCRIGPPQKKLVADARACVKNQTLDLIPTIFRRGQK